MQYVTIMHNPYKVRSTIEVNGAPPEQDSQFAQFLDQRFQLWVDQLPVLLADEYNDDAYEITFRGTELDYQDLVSAAEAAKEDPGFIDKYGNVEFFFHKEPGKEFGEKEADIRALFEQVRQLPFSELQSPAVADAFEKAFDEEFDVNVVATMSAGKSTLINALLGKKLMPSKNGACTATITRIKDDDDGTFKAEVLDSNKEVIERYSCLDYKTMRNLNGNKSVSEIHVSGNIPFVTSDEVSLVLIDTPGPDNVRDVQHGLVTARALDESSKMLVLFVMNGEKLHDSSQDAFLRNIAKSMSVGGKQSRERFLFVINKLDEYDEEDDDIAGETIPDTIDYLEEMGIHNPNIFPAAAQPALWIRQYQSTYDEEEKAKLLNKLEHAARNLVEQKQLHLETYASLPRSSQAKIDRELQDAIERNDLLGQALIHTGIRGIEEAISMYVTKYCRPAKITNVVNSFTHALDSAEAFSKTQRDITSQEKNLAVYHSQIELLEGKLKSQTENEAFKKRISNLDVNSKVDYYVDRLGKNVQDNLISFLNTGKPEMSYSEAISFVGEFRSLANREQEKFQVAVNRMLQEDVEAQGRLLVEEYINRLSRISQEFVNAGLPINLVSYATGRIAQISANDAINDSYDSRIEEHIENRTRPVTRRVRGWDRFLHIKYWFNPEYEDIENYSVSVKEEVTFISGDKLSNALLSPVQGALNKETISIKEYAKEATETIKENFSKQFDEVDGILAAKAQELKNALASEEAAAKALAAANLLLEQLNEVKRDLDAILEI